VGGHKTDALVASLVRTARPQNVEAHRSDAEDRRALQAQREGLVETESSSRL
jgi:hypothetical protein